LGFFSYECRGCKKSLLSFHATSATNDWMMEVVVLLKGDPPTIISGLYDGYGRVDTQDTLFDIANLKPPGPECWHKACWVCAGRPLKFAKPSKHAGDQGYFFEEEDYDIEEPVPSGEVAS
jgi:hypothetical protein